MNDQSPPPKYGISIHEIAGKVTARRGATPVAASTRARVMYETRLNPVIYVPFEDLTVTVSEPTVFRTFCPFKGTASYFDATVGGKTHRNAIWAYLNPLQESEAIRGHVGFMPNFVDRWDLPDHAFDPPESTHITGALVDWMLREAAQCWNAETLTRQFAHRLISDGVALSRIHITIWSLHPQIAGRAYRWNKATDEVETMTASHENLSRDVYMKSPVRLVTEGLGGVRQSLTTDNPEFSFPILDQLREAGATDYVAMPLTFSNGQINAITLTSDHPGGFTTAHLGHVFENLGILGRLYEVITLRENAQTLLGTYLGGRTGSRVLGGQIRRGEGEDIDAAILFCDLRGSTAWEERLSRADYLALLNTFFDVAISGVEGNDGEVLKLIGDAVFAIFPAEDDPDRAARQAMRAATAINGNLGTTLEEKGLPALGCAIGVSFGTVTYGNVGSENRLDFTVIGGAAAVAARLSDQCKVIESPILATKRIASAADVPTTSVGPVTLRNVSDPVEIFVPAPFASRGGSKPSNAEKIGA